MSKVFGSHDPSADARSTKGAGFSLDPQEWSGLRTQAHQMLDDMLDYIQNIRERPVWQPISEEVRARRRSGLPHQPADLAAVHREFMQDILPFAAGNVHPGFMGWVNGGGTPVGMLAEMLAAGLNANLGGRNQIPVEVEREVVRWMCEIFGFPEGASGLFVTGTSIANLVAVVVARDAALGYGVRADGVAAHPQRLTAYASTGVHGCVGKAMDVAGLGRDALRLVPTDNRYRIDLDALETSIRMDRDAGYTPFLVVGTAGSVDTGAVDDLAALADLCQQQKLWFHVDGAYGALARIAPDLAPALQGIERADSLAFDFHKWGQVPYDAGFVLIRDAAAHKSAFASRAVYLSRVDRGLAAGSPWPCDFGPDLSRGFRALKTWFTLKVYGTDALGKTISHACQLARYLESRVVATPELELMAPVNLNIVCFRYRSLEPDRVNEEIVIRLQESGVVAPSTTTLANHLVIRAAIVNHRTTRSDIDALVDGVLSLGRILVSVPADRVASPEALDSPSVKKLGAALEVVNQRLLSQPRSVELLFQRGNLQELMGSGPEAIDTYSELLRHNPNHRAALNKLGMLLCAAGRHAEARKVFARAVAGHPSDAISQVNYANSLRNEGESEEARKHFELALRVDPGNWKAHVGISAVLATLGQAGQASWHRRAAFQGRFIVPLPYRGKETPITVLELIAIGAGNTRFRNFLSDSVFKRYLVAAEFYDPAAPLPPHQLVVNSIGDADVTVEALHGAQALLAHSAAPVINRPESVLATGRCEIARRLAHLPGVITANTVTLPRESFAAPDAGAMLANHGFTFPLLLRTPGFHQGEHFLRVETSEGLPAALATLPGPELTAIQYLDASGRDGKIRKYRAMMIDGQLYPLHAAIASHWKIHYFSAEMADFPEHRAEDAAFLANMEGVLGPRALAALTAIQSALGLDYGGIDFGLNQEGDVLLFEANATMAVIPPGADERWDYRRPAVDRICRAVHQMLLSRAALGCQFSASCPQT